MADNGDDDGKDYTVGRGKPPVHTRWKKGVSGNPSGRSKKPPTLQEDLIEEGARLVPLPDGSGQITVQRAMVKSLLHRAIQKDNKAASLVIKIQTAAQSADAFTDDGGVLTDEEEVILKDFLTRHATRRGK